MSPRAALLAAVLLAAGPVSAAVPAPLRVVSARGDVRLFRFETVPWPLQAGAPLGADARFELAPGSLLRLRYATYLDLDAAGPARLAVYSVPSPNGPDAPPRLVVALTRGALLVDGRFQFGRSADIVLALPDRDLTLRPGERFFAVADGGASRLYTPGPPAAAGCPESLAPATPTASAVVPLPGAAPPRARAGVPDVLLGELHHRVRVFVVARDYNEDIGLWPRPAVLGPLLAERLARLPGLEVVAGSGEARFAHEANGALKKGDDAYLKSLARERGARWAVVGNCVAASAPRPGLPPGRWERATAEVRVLDVDDPPGALPLVSESGDTIVARAGRPLELAARQALEAASDQASRYTLWEIEDLLAGRPHAVTLLRLVVEGASKGALEALRRRLDALDSVQRFFRRRYYGHVADFDLMLRRPAGVFDAQWAALPASGGWSFRSLACADPGERRIRAVAPK